MNELRWKVSVFGSAWQWRQCRLMPSVCPEVSALGAGFSHIINCFLCQECTRSKKANELPSQFLFLPRQQWVLTFYACCISVFLSFFWHHAEHWAHILRIPPLQSFSPGTSLSSRPAFSACQVLVCLVPRTMPSTQSTLHFCCCLRFFCWDHSGLWTHVLLLVCPSLSPRIILGSRPAFLSPHFCPSLSLAPYCLLRHCFCTFFFSSPSYSSCLLVFRYFLVIDESLHWGYMLLKDSFV